jgi:hypothetical protein
MIALVLAAAVATTASPADDPAVQKMQELQVIWNQTCAVAGYGSYNDLCNSLKAQIRDYQKKQGKKTTPRPPQTDTVPTVAQAAKPAPAQN